MRRKALEPIRQAGDREHEKALTQTVRIASADVVPPAYRRFPVKSPSIYAKVQVLSSKRGLPVFIETSEADSQERVAYWVHEDVLPELSQWLRNRLFPISDIVEQNG